MYFQEKRGLAICGLACALCSAEDCPGCKERGGECPVYRCAVKKGLEGCHQCERFPCDEKMLSGIRSRAFNRYARLYGAPALLERLRINQKNGVVYHDPGCLTGDYDACCTEEEVLELLKNGRPGPYDRCSAYRAGRFILRLVSNQDAADLFECYSAPTPSMRANAEYCEYGYTPRTLEEMQAIIRRWLEEYRMRNFVRFSILDKETGRAVGTVELADGCPQGYGILRIDLAARYEAQTHLDALLKAADRFFTDFGCRKLVTRVIPQAVERVAALRRNGYDPCPIGGGWTREGYYFKEQPD